MNIGSIELSSVEGYVLREVPAAKTWRLSGCAMCMPVPDRLDGVLYDHVSGRRGRTHFTVLARLNGKGSIM